jgi:putative ABC transport system permease protein
VEFWCTPGFELKEFGRGSHFAFAVGRMKPGINIQQARAEMSTIADGLNATYRKTGSGVRLVPLQEEIVGNAKRGLLVLWAAVLAVLVIASANVAGLLLARAVSRHKEVAIRSALGGTRSRLIQQFLTESVLLALIGGSVGVALSYSAGRFLVSTSSGAVPRLRELQIDGWVLTFTAAACVVTGLAFGLAPAVNALRVDLNVSLKEGGLRVGSHRLGLRSILVVVELALAMVLLIAGGLLTKTLWRLQHVDAGFQPENLLSFRFAVVATKFPTAAQKGLYERISERLSELPGVESVGATNDLPFAGSRSSSSFDIEDRPPDPAMVLQADYRTVSPGYFRAMRMRLLAGRGFTVHDNQDGVYAAIVNQSFVMKFFPREEPLGHRLKSHDKLYQIVGVVADVKHENLAAPGFPEIYLPYLQADVPPSIFFVVRSHTDAQALSPAVRNAVNEVAPGQPIYSLNTMAHRIEFWMAPQKLNGLLLSVFAGLALVLAAIGIYGLIAYSVAQRTREIGIRIALGASRRDVLGLILRQGATMGIQGLAGGTAVAYLGTRALSSMLFGVEPHDPLIFFGVAASLILTVIVASYVPARKAARVDPLVAIRYE